MTGALLGFPQTSIGVVDVTNVGFVFDGRFGNCYGMANSGAISGLRKWDAYPNGKELLARNTANLGGGLTFYYPNCFTYRSQELVVGTGASNSASLNGYAMSDLTHTSTFGISSGSLAPSDSGRILASSMLAAFTDDKGGDVVMSCNITASSEINCIAWGAKYNHRLTVPELHVVLGAVPDGSGNCGYALGYNIGASAMHLYKVTQSSLTGGAKVTQIGGNILPSAINAAWTNIDAVFGITVDQTDGNLIAGFTNLSAPADRGYLTKFNSVTGAVMWSIAIAGPTGTITYAGQDMAKNIVKKGKLYYMGESQLIWIIDTLTGTHTTSLLDTAGPASINGHQMSEDCCGSVLWYGGFTQVGTVPTYLGQYCGVDGNHTGATMGWRYYVSGPPASGNCACAPLSPAATSRKRAWSFTLDGHTFYVLDLGQQGTFVFDRDSGSWSQFITDGYVAWNFASGCMWGQRIVAGDLLTTDVWEMLPGTSLLDNGAHQITHVVTGGVVTRNRIYHSVESFELACSVGQLQSVGATVTLSFSDDQGKTFTTMDTYTLTQGDYRAEIAWRSLGAFAAPGRIFRITDTGGFIRIDGADASIDNFDEAPPAGEQSQ